MKSITVFNNKGGVGKTTFLCNIASYIATEKNKKVLIIDADPQCNATVYVLPEEVAISIYEGSSSHTIDSFMEPIRKGKGYRTGQIDVIHSDRFGVDIVPGDPRLSLSEDLLASDWITGSSGDPRGLQTTFVFKELLLKFEGKYDYIFIDVGPSLGAINRAILIASDYFVVPMSSDIFSLMAIKNISLSLTKWKRNLTKGLIDYETEEGEPYNINNKPVSWTLEFAGYITQQYTSKMIDGQRRPVKAYDKIIKQIPRKVKDELIDKFSNFPSGTRYKLGEIPNLHSIVPMSQTANSPIFKLKAKDGVVGSHFAKVNEAYDIYGKISNSLVANIGGQL